MVAALTRNPAASPPIQPQRFRSSVCDLHRSAAPVRKPLASSGWLATELDTAKAHLGAPVACLGTRKRNPNPNWRTLRFSEDVRVTQLHSAKTRLVLAGQPVTIADSQVCIAGLPPELIREARAISFYAHPSFASFQTTDYYVRATVRRTAAGNVGMNLRYEVADSQGRSPYANVGQWFGVSPDGVWQTHTWHCKNACFSKMWGYDFVISPEQSVPFAIGKIEVSTEPFE